MKLIDNDKHTAVWLKIKAHLETLQKEYRVKNDGNLDQLQTANLRGKLGLLKVLLEMDQPEPANVAEHGIE